jgi:hypothetical protein
VAILYWRGINYKLIIDIFTILAATLLSWAYYALIPLLTIAGYGFVFLGATFSYA